VILSEKKANNNLNDFLLKSLEIVVNKTIITNEKTIIDENSDYKNVIRLCNYLENKCKKYNNNTINLENLSLINIYYIFTFLCNFIIKNFKVKDDIDIRLFKLKYFINCFIKKEKYQIDEDWQIIAA
jgi:hypothetical protein